MCSCRISSSRAAWSGRSPFILPHMNAIYGLSHHDFHTYKCPLHGINFAQRNHPAQGLGK